MAINYNLAKVYELSDNDPEFVLQIISNYVNSRPQKYCTRLVHNIFIILYSFKMLINHFKYVEHFKYYIIAPSLEPGQAIEPHTASETGRT